MMSAGHMTVVHDPLNTVSVLEPGGPGGCGMNHRATVEETAAASGCLFAQNAGFFDTRHSWCLGNVVSDGRLVQDSGGVQNAQFGIRRDGTLVFGYDQTSARPQPLFEKTKAVLTRDWCQRQRRAAVYVCATDGGVLPQQGG